MNFENRQAALFVPAYALAWGRLRTTKLYDRTSDTITLDEIEKIAI